MPLKRVKKRRRLAVQLLRVFGHVCKMTHPKTDVCRAVKVAERLFAELPDFDHEAPEVTGGKPGEKSKDDNRRSLRRAIRIVATGAGAGALMRGLLGIESKRAAVKQALAIVRQAPGGVTRTSASARSRGRGGFQFEAEKFIGANRRRRLALGKVLGFWPGEPGGDS